MHFGVTMGLKELKSTIFLILGCSLSVSNSLNASVQEMSSESSQSGKKSLLEEIEKTQKKFSNRNFRMLSKENTILALLDEDSIREDHQVVEPQYPVGRIDLSFIKPHPDNPSLEDLGYALVTLSLIEGVWTAPCEGEVTKEWEVAEFENLDRPVQLSSSAIVEISKVLVKDLNDKGFMGVYVFIDPNQIDRQGTDLRGTSNALSFKIHIGVLSEFNTLSRGERFEEGEGDEYENLPEHTFIIEGAPFGPDELLRKDLLDEYLAYLNRYPGRNVSAFISGASQAGEVNIDFLVHEQDPARFYYSASNTGTKSTSEWIHRAGYVDYQFTNHDDTLTFEYGTDGFDNIHFVTTSYEFPIYACERWRGKVLGAYSQFESSEFNIFTTSFRGNQWQAGIDFINNIFQSGPLFIDLIFGVKWKEIHAERTIGFTQEGDSSFLLPKIGASLLRRVIESTVVANFYFEGNIPQVFDTSTARVRLLGRDRVEKDWITFKGNAYISFYLEPLLNRESWEDVTTPRSSTLAHEVVLRSFGQFTTGHRVIPQEQFVLGGLNSVRGYPQSAAAGDSGLFLSGEYRVHIPRLFQIEPDPMKTSIMGKPFRFSPQQVHGGTDWDLIARAFADYGRTLIHSRPLATERSQHLSSAGLGIEFRFKDNLVIGVDWGHVLNSLKGLPVTYGSNRAHFSASCFF